MSAGDLISTDRINLYKSGCPFLKSKGPGSELLAVEVIFQRCSHLNMLKTSQGRNVNLS